MPIIKLDNTPRYFSTDDGILVSAEDAERIMSQALTRAKNLLVHDTVQTVENVESQIINLNLKNQDSNQTVQDGFLVTVYLVNTSGSLTQLYNSSIIDPSSGATIRESMQSYITIEVDV